MTRRSYAGAAAETTLNTGVGTGDTTVVLDSATGWPTGGNGPFFFVIDPGLSTEEKCTATGRTGASLTGVTRGADDTSASAHTAGAVIRHVWTKTDADEVNAHANDATLDHHTNYLTTGRHDVEARHTFGAAYGTPAAPADIGTAAATGSGNNPAREDHVHQLGTGAIDDAAQFAAGVVNLAAIAAPLPGGSLGTGERTTDLTPISAETTVATRGITTTRTTDILALAKIYRTDDTDGDVAWIAVRIYRDANVIDEILIEPSGAVGPGAVVFAYDDGVAAGSYTYTLKVEPNTGEFGVIAGNDSTRAVLVLLDVGTPA